jgi:site-specific DNA-methyltransferase (adenine-specific)/adenine-specific DNA-methyltransferase
MVMVDKDYRGDVFDLDLVYWADDLAAIGWVVSIASGQVGDRVMIVYLDVFGNEYREVKTPADFTGAAPEPPTAVADAT